MSQDIRLYGSAQVWDQPLQPGQRNLLQAIRDFWPADIASVLDVGCGDGKLTSQLATTGATLLGLDSSEEALSRLPFAGVKGDAQQLPFDDGSFDLVMSTDALEHMPDAEESAAWSELFRVAKKVVMVAVPFREELLDATAKCADCGHCYHVNWHQRSYDFADLHRRAPAGWSVRCTVLAGEPWSAMLPPETHLRRLALGEWSGWDAAICPECGADGQAAQPVQPLPSLLAQALGEKLYARLGEQLFCRSHSEILVIFQRKNAPCVDAVVIPAQQHSQLSSCLDLTSQLAAPNLLPFCQIAQYVSCADGQLRLQFPLFEPTPLLEVRRLPGTRGPLQLMLEDAQGILFEGCALEDGQEQTVHTLKRPPTPGYYGILGSCSAQEPFASIRLGMGPEIFFANKPEGAHCSYFSAEHAGRPLYLQVAHPLWLDTHVFDDVMPPSAVTPAEVLGHVQSCFERTLSKVLTDHPAHEENNLTTPAEVNSLQVKIQNLTAESSAYQQQAQLAEERAVELQNMTAERDALLLRAVEADQSAVKIQNLEAERTSMQRQNQLTENKLVQLQNMTAERDALLLRAVEADQLAVKIQNLEAELTSVQRQGQLDEKQLVQLQNMTAERDALLLRAAEADQLAVKVQNLEAECIGLQQAALQTDKQLVQLQNVTAERDALLVRAFEADKLAVHIQNLSAERDTLLEQTQYEEQLHRNTVDGLKASIVMLEVERDHLQSRSQEAENALCQTRETIALMTSDKQQLQHELRACQQQLEQLNQHIENRLGAITRRAVASLTGKK